MSAAHTPGPWCIEDGHLNRIIYGRGEDGKTVIAEAHWWVLDDAAESIANARLIAAAPDLLAACIALQMEARARNCGLRIADEAIAKATGPLTDGDTSSSIAEPNAVPGTTT